MESPLGSTRSVKYREPMQLSSATTGTPIDSMIECSFQLGMAIGHPENISLGLLGSPTPTARPVPFLQLVGELVGLQGEPVDVVVEARPG